MWKALRGRRRAVRGRAGAGGLRKGEGGGGLASARKGPDPGAAVSVSHPSDHAEPRNASSCRASLAAPRFHCSSGGGGLWNDDERQWLGRHRPAPLQRKKKVVVPGPVILPSLLSCHWPNHHDSAPHVTQRLSLHPNFPISIARRGRLSLPFLFFLCAASTYYTNTPVLLRSWLFGTIMDIVASVVVQSKHIAKLASFTSQSTEKHPPRARWWY